MSILGSITCQVDCGGSLYKRRLTEGENMALFHDERPSGCVRVVNGLCENVGVLDKSVARVLIPLIVSGTVYPKCIVDVTTLHGGQVTAFRCKVRVSAMPENFGLVETRIRDANLDYVKLDDAALFNSVCNVDPIEPPGRYITTGLLPHQKQALGWLRSRERNTDLPPFWAPGPNYDYYVNLLTCNEFPDKPDPVRGGILADDVGLGKTLTLLSLVAIDKEEEDFSASIKKQRFVIETSDGNQATPPAAAAAPAPTLIVSPRTRSKWFSQISTHTSNLSAYEFQPDDANVNVLGHDIVLSTYDTLLAEFSNHQDTSLLYTAEWRRIILDEAYTTKDFSKEQISALAALKSQRRWASTGISVRNGSLDLFPIMAFLIIPPFSVKGFWDSLVQTPFAAKFEVGVLRLQELMKPISLRRTKHKDVVGLRTKSVETFSVELSAKERAMYDQIENHARSFVSNNISSDEARPSNVSFLHMVLRLRQVCDAVPLCPLDLGALNLPTNSEDECKDPEIFKNLISLMQDGEDFYPDSGFSVSGAGDTSSKVDALLKLLSSSRDENPGMKSVVFSHFRGLLILLQKPLEAAGYKTFCLDWAMNTEMRDRVIKEFTEAGPNVPTVLLASFKALSADIDLSAAARVYLMEPWLNVALEEHAMDSVYHIGQAQDVKVVRLIASYTIEEKIMEQLEKRKELVTGLFLRWHKRHRPKGLEQLMEIGLDNLRDLVPL